MTGTVVVPVKAVHTLQFLAVVLETLYVTVGALTEEPAEGIVVVDLLNSAVLLDDSTVISEVVLQVVMVCRRTAAE